MSKPSAPRQSAAPQMSYVGKLSLILNAAPRGIDLAFSGERAITADHPGPRVLETGRGQCKEGRVWTRDDRNGSTSTVGWRSRERPQSAQPRPWRRSRRRTGIHPERPDTSGTMGPVAARSSGAGRRGRMARRAPGSCRVIGDGWCVQTRKTQEPRAYLDRPPRARSLRRRAPVQRLRRACPRWPRQLIFFATDRGRDSSSSGAHPARLTLTRGSLPCAVGTHHRSTGGSALRGSQM